MASNREELAYHHGNASSNKAEKQNLNWICWGFGHSNFSRRILLQWNLHSFQLDKIICEEKPHVTKILAKYEYVLIGLAYTGSEMYINIREAALDNACYTEGGTLRNNKYSVKQASRFTF